MIIGLAGKKQAGKDTTYNYIDKALTQTAIRMEHRSFARKLKESAGAIFGIEKNPVEWADAVKEVGLVKIDFPGTRNPGETITGREFLQRYGTEAHRDIFGDDFWVDAALPISTFDQWDRCMVFTDVRFPNEAQRVRDVGGFVWQIIRPGMDDGDAHSSEKPIDSDLIDLIVMNDEGLPELEVKVRTAVLETMSMINQEEVVSFG